MPYGNVSDIIMTRNPVQEAQGWSELYLKRKELEMKQEETRKKLTPQPYDFDFNEYGTENPYQQDFVADLEDMDYQLTLSDMEYLQIDPRDMDRCGETCQSAHRRLRNRRKGSEAIKAFADGTNSRYSDLQKKMQENGKQYLNAENLALAEKMKKGWGNGNQWQYNNETGMLEIMENVPLMVPQTSNGEPLYESKEGGTTLDKELAKLDESNNPVPAMVESEDQFDKKVTGMSEWWTSQGYDKPFINQGKNDFTWENYSKFIRTGEDGDLDRRETYNALSPYLFQGMAKWDDTSGEGVMPSHSSYLPNALREAQNEDGQPMFPPTHAVTKDELINYTIDMAWKDYQQKQILKDQEANRTQERKDNLADQQQAKINEELLAQMNKEQPPLTGRPTIKDVENQYEIPIIQGFDLDMSKKAKETSYQFNPQNTTLLVGDEVFRTKDLRGKGQMVNFEYTRIGNFYYNTELGRYLYGNEIEELKDDENTIIKPGAIGQWVPADQGTKQIWESEGLMLATDEGVGAIVDLRLVRDAASQESTDKSTNGPKVKLIEEQAEQMNSEKGNSKQGDAQYEGDAIFE